MKKIVLKEDPKWVKMFREQAEQGYVKSMFILGCIYNKGEGGIPKDDKEAVKWFRTAAAQGYAAAQHNLGAMYEYGVGVLQDYVAAYAWISLAASNGSDLGSRAREQVAKLMTPEQIAKARELTKELLKQIEANKAAKE